MVEDSDVMPWEVSSDRPPERCRKVKKNLRDRMISLGLEKWLKASVQEAPHVTKDGTIQHQGTAEKALTRARESEVAVDTGRTGFLVHTEVALLGNLVKRTRRGAGGPDEEVEILSQYELDRKRLKKANEDFMRSLGIILF